MTECESPGIIPKQVNVMWTPLVRDALRAEIKRRNALIDRSQIPPQKNWDMGSLSEHILREALGLPAPSIGGGG